MTHEIAFHPRGQALGYRRALSGWGKTVADFQDRFTHRRPGTRPAPTAVTLPSTRRGLMRRAVLTIPALAFILALLLPAPMAAAQPLTPDEFAAFATGRTLDYAVDGKVLGSEAYSPDRSVRDADTGGPCRTGVWYPDGPAVCFVYDGSDQRHCWLYWREDDKVLAKPLLAGPDDPAQTVTPAPNPLSCAPEVGV